MWQWLPSSILKFGKTLDLKTPVTEQAYSLAMNIGKVAPTMPILRAL